MNLRKIKQNIADYVLYNNEYVLQNYAEKCAQEDLSALKKLKLIVGLHKEDKKKKMALGKHIEGFYPEHRQLQPSYDVLLEQLLQYDVVSFDIFDTLVFRACEVPEDVFFLLEKEWNIMDFSTVRIETEKRLREKKAELTIYDIYEELANHYAFDVDQGVEKELAMEKAVCYANPYMKKIVDTLLEKGKRLIVISDMYITEKDMKELLAACGYSGFECVFVSCEHGINKGSGELQKYAMEQIGMECSYVHIGDNMYSDVKASKSIGWDAVHYKNIQKEGIRYRIPDMKSSGGRIYKGLVNAKLHGGYSRCTPLYEFGYAYGGPLVIGYLQYLKELAQNEGIDKFFFVARDGNILYKACSQFQILDTDFEYIPFSRFASYHVAIDRYLEEYMHNCIGTRIPYEQTIGQILSEIDAACMLPFLKEQGLTEEELLNEKNYKLLYQVFRSHKTTLEEMWSDSTEAATKYFKRVIGEHKHVCIVDIGWAGTSFFALRYFCEKIGISAQISGALLAARNTKSIQGAMEDRKLFYYLFGPDKNDDIMKKFFSGQKNNSKYYCNTLETLFSADQPSFLMFQSIEDAKVGFRYARSEENGQMVSQMQKGMLDFVNDYHMVEDRFGKILHINATDAYRPMERLLNDREYILELLGDFRMNTMSGIFEDDRIVTFRQIVTRR